MALNVRKIALFVLMTFALSWLLAETFFHLGGKLNSLLAMPVLVLYMFVPATVTVIVQKVICREGVVKPLQVSFKPNGWFLVAWISPLFLALGALGTALLLPGITFSPDMAGMFERYRGLVTPEQMKLMKQQIASLPIHPFWLGALAGLVAGPTVNTIAGFGEELGWRGFLQKELGPLGFWKSSLLIGFIWGVWHAPVIVRGYNYPQHPVAGALMMTAFAMLLAPAFSYIRLRAKSVIAPSILHGTLTATGGLAILVIKGGNDLTTGVTGLAGFVVLALVNLALVLYDQFLAAEPLMVQTKAERPAA